MSSVRLCRRGVAGFSHPAFCALLGLALGNQAQAQQPLFEFVQISDSQPQNSADNEGFVDVLRTIAEAGRPGALLPRSVDLVLFAGDITDGNSTSEWIAAKTKLDTWLTANGIPFRAVPGNHDVDGSDTTLYDQYIGSSDVWDIGSASFTGHNGLSRTTGWQGLRFIGFNNSNPDYNQISSSDVTRILTRVNAADAANENVFLLCHHPHDGSGRMPLVNVLPNPSIVGYLHGHSGSPRVKKGLSGITNPSVWDVDTNAIIYDRDLVYFDVYPNELRAHVVILNDNPTSLPPPVVIPLAHPLTTLTESLYGVAGPVHANARAGPSGASPERKLWQNAGSWWGILWSDSAAAYRIQRFNSSTQAWSDTATTVSTSPTRSFDALAAGNTLYVAANVPTVPSQSGNGSPGQLYRFTYSTGSSKYNLDAGFPVAVNDARSETLTLARDSTGTLWVTWTQGGQVFFNHSVGGNDAAWATPGELPGASGLAAEETSALVAFAGKIGVLWPKASAGTVSFALHADGDPDLVWQIESAVTQGALVGDQIDLVADQGRALAVVRAPNGRLTLLERSSDLPGFGIWTLREAAAAGTGLTHPLLVLDQAFNLLRLFATGPTLEGQSSLGGGAIFEKSASLATLSFPHGRGSPVVQDGAHPSMDFVTSSKQPANAAGDLLVLASNAETERYWHDLDGLVSAPVAPVAAFTASPLSGVAPLAVQFTDHTSGTPTDWLWTFGDGTTSSQRSPTHVYGAAGTFTVSLRAASGGGENTLTRQGYVNVTPPLPGSTFTPIADARVSESNPNSALGLDAVLRIKTQAGSSFQSFLKFDLSSIAGTVQSARLRLRCTDPADSGGSVYVVASNAWTESGITWANRPALAATPVGSLGSVTAGVWAEVDVTAAFSGPGTYSLAVAGGTTNSAYYSSREGANPPQLVLTLSGSTPAPVASFSATPLTGTAPLSVTFTDLSTNAPTSWTWTFGDGTTSTTRNPVHVYTQPGPKTVRLDASNATGTGTLTRVDYIVVAAPPPAPVANFSATPLTGTAPLSVTFTDLSTNAPTSWTWTFGDGTSSTARNPVHVYTQPGPKTVRLDASNATGTGTLTRVDYIAVGAPSGNGTFVPVADARVIQASPNTNLGLETTLQVRNLSGSLANSYLRFDLSSLQGSVASAKLRVYCTDGSNSGGRLYALTNNSWTETGITWNNKPALPTSSLKGLGIASANSWIEIDVTSTVQNAGLYSFALANGSGDSAFYSSREGSNPPQLVIQTGP